MNGYFPDEVVRTDVNVVVAAQTNLAVSKEFRISGQGSVKFRVDLVADAVTVGAGITAKLQTTSGVDKDGNEDWVDAKTTAVTAAGSFSISLLAQLAADQTYLPLRPKGRVVVTTGAGSAVTFESIRIMQEE